MSNWGDIVMRILDGNQWWKASIVGLVLALGCVPAAQAESIRVLNWSNYTDPSVVRMFRTTTGIKVEYITYDSDEEIVPAALDYLGEQPNSTDPATIAKAEAVLMAIRPHIRYIVSTGCTMRRPPAGRS